jgi:hypothetical protein
VIAAAARRFAWFEGDNNQADATLLSAMGYDFLEMPVVAMPQVNREGLVKVEWPDAA